MARETEASKVGRLTRRVEQLEQERERLNVEVAEMREEMRATWSIARDANGQLESFRIIERMVDRLGYGRTEGNPSLARKPQAAEAEEGKSDG